MPPSLVNFFFSGKFSVDTKEKQTQAGAQLINSLPNERPDRRERESEKRTPRFQSTFELQRPFFCNWYRF